MTMDSEKMESIDLGFGYLYYYGDKKWIKLKQF
jgi:hypothetical protein